MNTNKKSKTMAERVWLKVFLSIIALFAFSKLMDTLLELQGGPLVDADEQRGDVKSEVEAGVNIESLGINVYIKKTVEYKGNGGKEALDPLQESAEEGDAEAQFNLGLRYYRGDGVEQDKKKAVDWWEEAARQGYADAQNNLGVLYYEGDGVKQDKKKAVDWWEEAARQGYADAQNSLGVMYAKGEGGLELDQRKAVDWWKEAAGQGDADARYYLGVVYDKGDSLATKSDALVREDLGSMHQNDAREVPDMKDEQRPFSAPPPNNFDFIDRNGEGVMRDMGADRQIYTPAPNFLDRLN